ncbi:MAG TPA: hypothetical protein PKC40_01650 [Saprospiraceae bacterium]|nr:hypothetical protein [Saprospiraceae bacterium]
MKILTRIFFTILAFFAAATPASEGCGPVDYRFQGYSFFRPKAYVSVRDYPQLLGMFAGMMDWYAKAEKKQEDDNLEEWRQKFCSYADTADVRYVIYQSTGDELYELLTAAKSRSIPPPPTLRGNTFAEQLAGNKCSETIEYLIFAKKCEPYVTVGDPWEDLKPDTEAMLQLIDEGKELFMRTESAFIRMRFAFQLVRLAHYARQYDLALELYDFLMPKIDPRVQSITRYWILAHRAGALKALARRVEAARLFAQVFQNCPSKREQAFRSFSIKTDEEWEQCQLLCESDAERATLYALRAYNEQNRALEEMEKIYQFNPANDLLPMLLIREVKKLERDLLGYTFNDKKEQNRRLHHVPRKNASALLHKWLAFIKKVRVEKKVPDRALWQAAEAYLVLLGGDFEEAQTLVEKMAEENESPRIAQQLDLFKAVLKILGWKIADESTEIEAFALLKESPFAEETPDFKDFLMDKMAALYAELGAPGRAFMCRYSLVELKANPQREIIDDLLALCQKEKKSRFERMLAEENGVSIENDLLDIKATYFLQKGMLEAANETFKKIPRTQWDRFGLFNPFAERFSECVHCPLQDTVRLINKGEILERLVELEYSAKAEVGENAHFYYLLGTAYFNLSYFGHSWQMADYYRSGSSWYYRNEENTYTTWLFPYGNKELINCSRALECFKMAREQSLDAELAAKATFMAARCEQDLYFVSKEKPAKKPRTFFQLLKKENSQTVFYNQIIKECKYLRAFAGK